MPRVAVIGGGLSGLAAAYGLLRARQSVCVLEASDALGGQIVTELAGGYVIEHGAEGFVAKSETVPRLARDLGVDGELIGQSTLRGLGLRGGEMRELAPGEAASLLGFQVSREDLGSGIRSFRAGMGALIDALSNALAARVELRTGFAVEGLTRMDRGYRIRNQNGLHIDAERVVIATSARAAARLLTPLCGPAASPLKTASVLSSVTVSLGYARASVSHPLDATGFVVATDDQQHGLRACTFVSSKFESRAPADRVCLRAFFRPQDSEISLVADSTYAQRAHALLEPLLGITGAPERSWVSRWPDALPVFDQEHKDAVANLTTALSGSGIALAGSAFHGSGIDAAVKSALSVPERF